MSWVTLFIIALCVLPIFSVHSRLTIRKAKERIIGRHIVMLKDGVSREAHVKASFHKTDNTSWITHEWDIVNGFAGYFSAEDLENLRSHPDVASIEEDGYVAQAARFESQ